MKTSTKILCAVMAVVCLALCACQKNPTDVDVPDGMQLASSEIVDYYLFVPADWRLDLSVRTMFIMAVATSIDALAVGISLAMAGNVNIVLAVSLIGATTFTLSAIGVKVGNVFGSRFEKNAQIAGGVILILLGLKILLEHLGVIA